MSKPIGNDQLKLYLDYLDKEMTIMGILSTFCVVVLGFVAEKLLYTKDLIYDLWKNTPFFCESGLAAFLLAGLAFYRQRSLLAWYYGQISLYQSREDYDNVRQLLTDSDKWLNWRWYQAGFGFLTLGFSELGCATLSTFISWFQTHQILICLSVVGLTLIAFSYIIIAYSSAETDEPLTELWRRMLGKRSI